MFTSLRMERFKNFKDAELKLGPFTVLIGANASGKSNIRDAFRFLHGISRGYSLADIIGEKYGEGGERIWSGIRGGAKEIAFSGDQSFVLTSQSVVPAGARLLRHVRDYEGEALHYQIGVEIRQKELIPKILLESLGICEASNLFLSQSKNRQYHHVNLYVDFDKLKPIGPYTLPRTFPLLGQMLTELRNFPSGLQFVTVEDSQQASLEEDFLESSIGRLMPSASDPCPARTY
jgi:AAA domain, putative AbiEii toxin, Type IV TA system